MAWLMITKRKAFLDRDLCNVSYFRRFQLLNGHQSSTRKAVSSYSFELFLVSLGKKYLFVHLLLLRVLSESLGLSMQEMFANGHLSRLSESVVKLFEANAVRA